MAGAGYKLFQTGDVLTAAQVNTYLNEQTVMVFADAAARTTALTSVLAEGMVSYLQDTNAVEVYNGSAWVGVSGAGDVTEVQAGTGISVASGTGPIPVVTNTMATAIDAKGDLVVGTGADTFSRLAVGGTNGHTLQVDSSTSTGLKWAAPSADSWTLISTSTPSGATAIDFTGISSTYSQLKLTWAGVYASANNTILLIKLNNDAGTNYYQREMNFLASTISTGFTSGSGNENLGAIFVRTTSSGLDKAACGSMTIYNANGTTKDKLIELQSSFYRDDNSTVVYRLSNVRYDSTSAISEINIFRLETAGTISVNADGFIQLWGQK